MNALFSIACIAALVALTACATSEPYVFAPGVTGSNGATVMSSSKKFGLIFATDETHVIAVDGEPIPTLGLRPILLAPGEHELGVRFEFGAFAASDILSVDLKSAGIYAVRGEKQGPCTVWLWVQDQKTGEVLGKKQLARLTGAFVVSAWVTKVTCGTNRD